MKSDSPLLLGVFPNRELAEGRIDELEHAGLRSQPTRHPAPGGKVEEAELPTGHQEDAAAEGAEIGAVAGGSLGILAGAIAVAAIPGIGLAVTGGILTVPRGGNRSRAPASRAHLPGRSSRWG